MSVGDRLQAARAAWWLRACTRVGRHPLLLGRPSIYASPGRLLIGDRFRLSSRPVASHLVAGPEGVLEIGQDVSIAHGAAIAAFERVTIGDRTAIGPYVVIMDTNFHGGSGNQSVQHECRPVEIGRDCRIGSRVTITRGATIGDGAEILAGSVVSSAIPAGACAGGARARVVGRAGDPSSGWDSAAAALPELVSDVFELDAPPDLDSSLSILSADPARMRRLVGAIEDRFGVVLGLSAVLTSTDLAELAARVDRAVLARPEAPGR